jgi:hypothetical protein
MASGSSALDAIAQAIAQNEGYNVQGSLPNRLNNPGDLTSNGQLLSYDTPASGWSALVSKLQNIFSGNSKVYSPNMTLNQFTDVYTNNDPNAANNIASNLGVNPSDTLQQIYNKLLNGTQSFSDTMQGAANKLNDTLQKGAQDAVNIGMFNGDPFSVSSSIVVRAIAVVAGLLLIAGAIWGFDNLRDTAVSTAKKGAEIAAA